MRYLFTYLVVMICATSSKITNAQTRDWSIGIQGSEYVHFNKARHFGLTGISNNTNVSFSTGFGVQAVKKWKRNWEVAFTLHYYKETNTVGAYFDHIKYEQDYNNGDGSGAKIAMTAGRYSYHNIGISAGLNYHFLVKKHHTFYVHSYIQNNWMFESNYTPTESWYPDGVVVSKLQPFDVMLNIGLGSSIYFQDRVKLNIAPFVNVMSLQRRDDLLMYDFDRKQIRFIKHAGIHLSLQYSI